MIDPTHIEPQLSSLELEFPVPDRPLEHSEDQPTDFADWSTAMSPWRQYLTRQAEIEGVSEKREHPVSLVSFEL
ncbi:MAG: hypothetical protein AAF236_03285 [Verrucomicrobiota bacterium]